MEQLLLKRFCSRRKLIFSLYIVKFWKCGFSYMHFRMLIFGWNPKIPIHIFWPFTRYHWVCHIQVPMLIMSITYMECTLQDKEFEYFRGLYDPLFKICHAAKRPVAVVEEGPQGPDQFYEWLQDWSNLSFINLYIYHMQIM